MLIFLDEPQGQEETLLAGLQRLPIGNMMRQAAREGNDFYTRGQYGKFRREQIYDPKTDSVRQGKIKRDKDGRPLRRQERLDKRKFPRQDGDGRMPPDLRERIDERMKKAMDAIDAFDPVEAEWREKENRIRNKPDIDPAAAVELIQPIAPLDGDIRPAGMIPGV